MEYRILKGYPYYRIYEDGTVVRMPHTTAKGMRLKEKEIKPYPIKNGYLMVGLHDAKGQNKQFYLHRLVYEAFFGQIPDGYEIDHIDGNRVNCKAQNIRIASHSANCRNPESVKRYKVSNARDKGKYDRASLNRGIKTTDDMILGTYMILLERYGRVSIMQLMAEAHCGYPRAKRIMERLTA